MSIAGLLETVRVRNSQVISLAEAVSLAVRVEPELVRRARLELVPEADASVEADLWFSPLVDVQSTSAFMFLPDAAALLRRRLGADRNRLERAWTVTREVHANAAPALALEEEVNYLTLAEGPDSPQLQRRLQEAVVALVAGGESRTGVARWATRALARLPEEVARSEAGLMLTVAARSRLGHADVLPEGVTPETEWLPWVLPRDSDHVRIGVRLFDEGLEIGDPDEQAGHVVPLPRTDPLVLHVAWREGPDERRRYVRVRPDQVTRIRVQNAARTTFTLQTAWGDSYVVRPRTAPVPIAIRAHAGGHDAFVAWRPSERIDECLGFALYRRDADGTERVVANPLTFPEDASSAAAADTPSTRAPFQRSTWLDGGIPTGQRVQYRVVPMLGLSGELREGAGSDWCDPIAISASAEPGLSITFNRGALGLSALAAQLGPQSLPELLAQAGSTAREYLGADLHAGLMAFLAGVREGGGSLNAALYELNDPEVLRHLGELGPRAHILVDRQAFDRNQSTLKVLLGRGVDVQRVAPRSGGLFHHRFAVACDAAGAPERLWVGGANWTTTGLFLQASSAAIIESRELAAVFLEQWHAARAGRPAASSAPAVVRVGSAQISVWFTPTRARADLVDVERRLGKARRGILFAMPFATRLVDEVRHAVGPARVYVRGVVTDSSRRIVVLFDGAQTQSITPSAFVSSELRRSLGLSQFTEFLARMVVLDPYDPGSTVLTGSHNLSASGSSKNNETLLIVENAPAFAAAHAVRVMALYKHYESRAALARSPKRFVGLRGDDRWQDPLFGAEQQRELSFWVSPVADTSSSAKSAAGPRRDRRAPRAPRSDPRSRRTQAR